MESNVGAHKNTAAPLPAGRHTLVCLVNSSQGTGLVGVLPSEYRLHHLRGGEGRGGGIRSNHRLYLSPSIQVLLHTAVN